LHELRWSEYGAGTYDGSNGLVGCGEAVNFLNDDGGQANGGNGNADSSYNNDYYHYNNKWPPSWWYLGATQCFRANVAFTLYGVKAGKSLPDGETPCSGMRYINSFFTRYGIESFGDALDINYESYGPSSSCYPATEDFMYYVQYENNKEIYPTAYSFGTGCSADGFFELVTFTGAYCNGRAGTQTTNQLLLFNSNLEAYSCVMVYNATAATAANNDDVNAASSQSSAGDAATYLLAKSTVCSSTEYPDRCPDPYGIKATREAKLYRMARSHSHTVPFYIPTLTVSLVAGAAMLFWLTHRRRPVKPRNQWELMAASFDRAASELAIRTMSYREKLLLYAEELEEEEEDSLRIVEPSYKYQPPLKPSIKSNTRPLGLISVEREPIASGTVVAVPPGNSNKVELPTTATTTGAPDSSVKYKRPMMARLAQRLFGPRNKPVAGKVSAAPLPIITSRSIRTTTRSGGNAPFMNGATTPLSPVYEGSEPPPTPSTIL
jgi:hypothetical protein